MITRKPVFVSEGVRISSNLFSKYMSQDMEKSGRVEIGGSSPRVALLSGLSAKSFGDIRAGGDLGTEAPSAYSELNGDLKAMIRLSSKQLLTIAYQHVHQDDVPRFDQVAQRGYQVYSFDPQIRQLGYARFQSFSIVKWRRSINLTASWQRSIEQRIKRKADSIIRTTEKDNVTVRGLSLEIHSEPVSYWTITSGFDFYADEVHSWRRDEDLSTNIITEKRGLYPDGSTASNFAVFMDNSITYGKMSLKMGARFNHYTLSSSDDVFGELSISPDALLGSASVMYAIHQQHKVFVSLSQGFRAPNINDVSSLGGFDYGIEVPSTSLDPEKSVNIEVGYKSAMNRMTNSVAVYRTNLYNLIDRVQSMYDGSEYYEDQRVYQKQNVDRAYIQGLEMETEIHALQQLVFFGHFIYTYGQKTETDEPMRRIPPLNGQIGLRWQNYRGAMAEARVLLAGKQDRLAAGDIDDHRIPEDGTPGWVIFNIDGSYTVNSRIELMLGIHNLFNEAYRLHGSGVDGYGRSMWIGMKLRL